MRRHGCVYFLIFVVLLTKAERVACAQDTEIWHQPVRERAHPEFAPIGMVLGQYLFLPHVILKEQYNDNIFTSDQNEDSDFITTISPAFGLRLLESRHEAELTARSDIERYNDHNGENIEDFNIAFNGTLEARHDIKIPMRVAYDIGHEDREDDLNLDNATERLGIDIFDAALGVVYKPNRLALSAHLAYRQERYEDGVNFNGAPVIRSDGDRDHLAGTLRASYDLKPNHTVFVQGTYAQTDYDRRNFQGGAFQGDFRDHDRYGVLAGWQTNYKGNIFADIGAGWSSVDYDASSISDVQNFALDATLDWNVTKLTTIGFEALRENEQDNEVVEAIVRTKGGVSVDHELKRNVILGAAGFYEQRDFEDSNRKDDIADLRLLFDYLLNPHFSLGAEYRYTMRDSTQNNFDFDRNIIQMRLTGRL